MFITNSIIKDFGRKQASIHSKKLNKEIDFVGFNNIENSKIKISDFQIFDNCLLHFQVIKYKGMKIFDINNNMIRDSYISDKWIHSSERVYYPINCYPEQCLNGDLEFFINNNMSQSPREV